MKEAERDDRAAEQTNPDLSPSEAKSSLTDEDLEKVSGGVGRRPGPGTQTEDEAYIG